MGREIWCPTLGGTSTFIGLYEALASYYLIILLSHYLIHLNLVAHFLFSEGQ